MYTAQGKIEQRDLLDEYLPLVRRQALALQVRLPASIELDDLIQAGTVGLLEALGRFDATQGASFSTFASQRIRGAMLDELRSRDWLPRSVRRGARAADEAARRLEQSLGRPPEETEIAKALDMDIVAYRRLLSDTNSGQLLPFEELMAEGGEGRLQDNEIGETPFSLLVDDERRGHLVAAIEALPEREKLLMALYYQEELNLKEIGAVLDVTESRVCQLHSQAVGRLRGRLKETTSSESDSS